MNKTIISLIIIVLVIIGLFTYMYVSKEGVFAKYSTIVYPDGCEERFKNDVAITTLCTRERLVKDGLLNGTTT